MCDFGQEYFLNVKFTFWILIIWRPILGLNGQEHNIYI